VAVDDAYLSSDRNPTRRTRHCCPRRPRRPTCCWSVRANDLAPGGLRGREVELVANEASFVRFDGGRVLLVAHLGRASTLTRRSRIYLGHFLLVLEHQFRRLAPCGRHGHVEIQVREAEPLHDHVEVALRGRVEALAMPFDDADTVRRVPHHVERLVVVVRAADDLTFRHCRLASISPNFQEVNRLSIYR